MSKAKLIKKIAVRSVFGSKGDILSLVIADKTKSHQLMRVVGVASGLKTGEGDNGPWVGLVGQFKATNTTTGEVFQSGQCFIPDIAADLVVGALKGGAMAVEFGFDISAIFDEASATSYVYTAEPLFDTAENDPVSMLESKLAEQHARLENKAAPKGKKGDA